MAEFMPTPRWHDHDYAQRRLAEIKERHYPNGDTLQMVADFEWLIDEAEFLRGRLAVWRGVEMKDSWHGTPGGYTNHHCRCGDCRQAHATAQARQRARRRQRLDDGFTQFTHGADGYQEWGCRCDVCKTARNDRERQRYSRTAKGTAS